MYDIIINSDIEIWDRQYNDMIYQGNIIEYEGSYDNNGNIYMLTIRFEKFNESSERSIIISYITGYAIIGYNIIPISNININIGLNPTIIPYEQHRSKILKGTIESAINAYDPIDTRGLDNLPQLPLYFDDIRAEYIVNYLDSDDRARGYGWLLYAYKKYGSIAIDLAYV